MHIKETLREIFFHQRKLKRAKFYLSDSIYTIVLTTAIGSLGYAECSLYEMGFFVQQSDSKTE